MLSLSEPSAAGTTTQPGWVTEARCRSSISRIWESPPDQKGLPPRIAALLGEPAAQHAARRVPRPQRVRHRVEQEPRRAITVVIRDRPGADYLHKLLGEGRHDLCEDLDHEMLGYNEKAATFEPRRHEERGETQQEEENHL